MEKSNDLMLEKNMPKPTTNQLFPVFLKLNELKVLLVGGGNIGLEKLNALLSNSPNANISLVAPTIHSEIVALQQKHPQLRIIQRSFLSTDLTHKDIIICATDDPILHKEIYHQTRITNQLINVADTPEWCDFYLSSIVQKGNLKIAISTNGQSPTIAKRMKEFLNEIIPLEINTSIEQLHEIRNQTKGNFQQKVKKLNAITALLTDKKNNHPYFNKKYFSWVLIIFASMLIGHFLFSYFSLENIGLGAKDIVASIDANFGWMLLAGFLAQMVDGALGMGYGLTSASVLMTTGINPAAISGSIHTAEMFASGASGYSHYKFGNVNKKLFKIIVIPGVIGAIGGAILLVYLGEKYSSYAKTLVAFYTLFLGVKFIFNAFKQVTRKPYSRYGWLAGFGGFFDSFGGGGWGPIVTSTLINTGRTHRFVVGTVSLTEFFVTLASAFTFFIFLGISHWQTILGLIIGGLIAAPIAAKLAGKLPRKTSYILLGTLVIAWSLKILLKNI